MTETASCLRGFVVQIFLRRFQTKSRKQTQFQLKKRGNVQHLQSPEVTERVQKGFNSGTEMVWFWVVWRFPRRSCSTACDLRRHCGSAKNRRHRKFPQEHLPKGTPTKFLLARRDALKARPSAAKAACVAGSNGMAKAMPFPRLRAKRLNQRFPKQNALANISLGCGRHPRTGVVLAHRGSGIRYASYRRHRAARMGSQAAAANGEPRVSIIVPARNEEENIARPDAVARPRLFQLRNYCVE